MFRARTGIGIDAAVVLEQFDVETKTLQFTYKHVEGFRNVDLADRFSLDDGFVSLGTSWDVVRLNGENFLKRVRSTVSFKCPYFHFTKALTSKLRLTTKRLLGNERVRTNGALVDLVLNHVVQLQHIDVADRRVVVVAVAGAAVKQSDLSVFREAGLLQFFTNRVFRNAVEHRGCDNVAKRVSGKAQVGFQNLTQVHT